MVPRITDLAFDPDRPATVPDGQASARPGPLGQGTGYTGRPAAHSGGDVVAVYQYAARAGALTPDSIDLVSMELGLSPGEVFAAAVRLVELRLLRTGEGGGAALVPLDARSAASLLTSPIERAILQQQDLAERLRARIKEIANEAAGGQEGPLAVIDSVEGAAEVRGLLRLAAAECRAEAVLLRPGHDGEHTPDDLFDACYDALGPEVALRVLSPHRDRADFASRARAKRLAERGADIRTIRAIPQCAAVFDRTRAVMVTAPGAHGPVSARLVHEAPFVDCLTDLFDLLWDGAAPFAVDEAGYADDISDDLQRTIARLMAQGLTDDAVARRLGMSVRTCRRHIAALMRSLGSVSRFQAGVQVAHRLSREGAA